MVLPCPVVVAEQAKTYDHRVHDTFHADLTDATWSMYLGAHVEYVANDENGLHGHDLGGVVGESPISCLRPHTISTSLFTPTPSPFALPSPAPISHFPPHPNTLHAYPPSAPPTVKPGKLSALTPPLLRVASIIPPPRLTPLAPLPPRCFPESQPSPKAHSHHPSSPIRQS